MASTARIEELKKKFDENPRRYFAPLANEYRKSGDVDQAIALCRAHLPQQPGHISGHIVLAQALYEARDLGEAQQIFSLALELDPENLIALRFLGDIARETGDVGSARGWYSRVLDVDPRNDEITGLIRALDQTPPSAPAVEYADRPVAASTAVETAPDDEAIDLDDEEAATEIVAIGAAPAVEPDAEPQVVSDATAIEQQFPEIGDEPFQPDEYPPAEIDEEDPFGMPTAEAQKAYEDALFNDMSGMSPSDDFGDLASGPTPSIEDWRRATPADAQAADTGLPSLLDETLESFEATSLDAGAGPSHAVDEPIDMASMAASADAPVSEHLTPPSNRVTGELAEATFDDAFASFTTEEGETSPAASADAASSTEPAAPGESTLEGFDLIDSADAPDADPPLADAVVATTESASAPDQVSTNDWPAPAELDTAITPVYSAAVESDVVSGEVLGLEVMEFQAPAGTASSSLVEAQADLSAGAATPDAFVTETMAELYLQQGFRDEALEVYRELLHRSPNDDSLRERVEQIESGASSSISIAKLSDDVIESARRRQTERPVRTVRTFFAVLASKQPPARAVRHDYAAPDVVDAPSVDVGHPSLDTLFAHSAVPASDDSAAAALATAFSPPDAPGRPSHAATSELSLARVFRDTNDGRAGESDSDGGGSFSFDQFFTDPTTTGEEVTAASVPARANANEDRSGDIEQFNAWLEGLKRK